MFDNNKLGEIRPNQLITTFGPGSIVDAVKDSVTVLDLNYWKEKGKKIIDGRLASYLGVDCFYMPRTSYSGDIPVVSFPYMHVCSNVKCGRIFDLRENFDLNSVYTRSGQNSTPNSNATNLHSSQKRCCSFCISSSNASPTFQVQKSIFHQMTKPIQVTVILPLLLAISFSRNDDIHSSISGISNDLIGVIPTIGQ